MLSCMGATIFRAGELRLQDTPTCVVYGTRITFGCHHSDEGFSRVALARIYKVKSAISER